MPRKVFSDFDAFADSIRGIDGRFVPTARSEGEWWVDVGAIGRVEVQQLQVGGASTYAGDGTPHTLTLGVPLSDPERIRIDGQLLEQNSLIFLKRNQPFIFAAQEATRWGGVTIHMNEQSGIAMFDVEQVMASLRRGTRAQTRLECLNHLRQLIERMGMQDGSVGFADPAAVSAAQEEMFNAVLRTIETSSVTHERRFGRPQVSRYRVISNTLDLIKAMEGKPLLIEDLCRATKVSERTLRNVFQEFFGVAPIRLLKARQLLEIRRALLAADSAQETVKTVASRFGVWDFSLFAHHYKTLYGEQPSVALRQPPANSTSSPEVSWIAHAARRFTRSF